MGCINENEFKLLFHLLATCCRRLQFIFKVVNNYHRHVYRFWRALMYAVLMFVWSCVSVELCMSLVKRAVVFLLFIQLSMFPYYWTSTIFLRSVALASRRTPWLCARGSVWKLGSWACVAHRTGAKTTRVFRLHRNVHVHEHTCIYASSHRRVADRSILTWGLSWSTERTVYEE